MGVLKLFRILYLSFSLYFVNLILIDKDMFSNENIFVFRIQQLMECGMINFGLLFFCFTSRSTFSSYVV